jgi:hypothetical protein
MTDLHLNILPKIENLEINELYSHVESLISIHKDLNKNLLLNGLDPKKQ